MPRSSARWWAARKPATRQALADAWYDDATDLAGRARHYHRSRYHGLNLHSVWYRGTVEFRWFNGTLDPATIEAYVLLCLGLAAKAAQAGKVQTKPAGKTNPRRSMYRFLRSIGFKATGYQKALAVLLRHLPDSRRTAVA